MKIYAILMILLLAACAKEAEQSTEPEPVVEPVQMVETCTDGVRNQDETGVDCGGVCKICETCSDGIQNQREQGVDCGGPCPACQTCTDGVQNQNEQGIDCGGVCKPCPVEKYEIYTEDFNDLQDKMKPNIAGVFLRSALPTGLDLGETYVFALGITNTMTTTETFLVDVVFVKAEHMNTNAIEEADEATILQWFEKNDWGEYTLDQYEEAPVPVGVTVGDFIASGESTPPGNYYFKVVITYKGKYSNKEYTEVPFNFRVK